jgi:hypothetical protein
MATTYRYPGSLPTVPRPRRPLIVELLMPLRVPLLFAVILAAWPLVLPLAWLALLTYCGVWLIRDKLRSPVTTKAITPAAPAPAPAAAAAAAAARPGRKTSVLQPSVVAAIRDNGSRVAIQETSANRIRPTGGQLRKR